MCELVRDLREDHDLKQKDVANYLKISQQTYSNYENGRREIPTFVVADLAKFYKVSTDYLLRAETGYVGNISLKAPYLDNITMRDVMYDIQKLKLQGRRELVRYLHYLGTIEGCEISPKNDKTFKNR